MIEHSNLIEIITNNKKEFDLLDKPIVGFINHLNILHNNDELSYHQRVKLEYANKLAATIYLHRNIDNDKIFNLKENDFEYLMSLTRGVKLSNKFKNKEDISDLIEEILVNDTKAKKVNEDIALNTSKVFTKLLINKFTKQINRYGKGETPEENINPIPYLGRMIGNFFRLRAYFEILVNENCLSEKNKEINDFVLFFKDTIDFSKYRENDGKDFVIFSYKILKKEQIINQLIDSYKNCEDIEEKILIIEQIGQNLKDMKEEFSLKQIHFEVIEKNIREFLLNLKLSDKDSKSLNKKMKI